ncbi:Cof-type HAD-IIB family hydrolase [Orbaceae bacterium ESL0727]|nr:Cof-type HAD-IIB family hydrolase [Orbaceae bacterium ESL0727]
MIKLIITDLDGTFLNSQGDYDRESFKTIRKLMQEKNVHFAVCTGKQCERVEELFGDNLKDLWIVGDSATRIKYNGQFIYQSLIRNELGQRIIYMLEQIDSQHVIIACISDGAVIRADTPPKLKNKLRHSYSNIIEVDSFAAITSDFVKITVYDEDNQCQQIRSYLSDFDTHVYIIVSEDAWMDITALGVHKGTTIGKLQALLEVTKSETMAFGDGYNDIELLTMAEYSFAMRNAFKETQDVANFITGYNDENAVQETIKRLLLLQP